MLGSNNGSVLADEVALVADDEGVGYVDQTERGVAVSIAECHNGVDARGLGSGKTLKGLVDELSTLRVARDDNLGRGAARGSLYESV